MRSLARLTWKIGKNLDLCKVTVVSRGPPSYKPRSDGLHSLQRFSFRPSSLLQLEAFLTQSSSMLRLAVVLPFFLFFVESDLTN